MSATATTKSPAAMQSRHALDLTRDEFTKAKRTFTLDRSAIDQDARTVPIAFASEEPVERWFGREILDISDAACDLSRLRTGGAVMVNHNWDDQVGVILEASIDRATRKARCVAKFSRSQRGEDIFRDIVDGIRTLVSVGYIVRKMVLESVDGDVETHRVTEWQPYEVSIVAVPADYKQSGVGRSISPDQTRQGAPSPMKTDTGAAGATATPPANDQTRTAPVVVQVSDLAAERQRVKDINAAARTLAERHPKHAEQIRAMAEKSVESGATAGEMQVGVLNDVLGTERTITPVRQDPNAATLGLSKKERASYSILRAIRAAMNNETLTGAEREFSDEVARRLERQPKGFFVPDDIILDRRNGRRTLLASSPVDGGFTVGSEILSSEFEILLRNNTRVVKLGARMIAGLVGDVSIPRQLTGASAYWVSETGSITQSSATFGQIVGKPRRVGTSVPYGKQFLAQTSLDAESFVVNDSDAAIAVDLDRVAIRGAGNAEPLGILNLPTADRSTNVTFGAAPTWAKYLEFFANVAGNNAIDGQFGYLTTVASAVKAMTVPKFPNGDEPIWTNDSKVGMFPAEWSTNFPTSGTQNQVIGGVFSNVIFLEWAGRDVVVDPYSGKKEGTVEVTIQRLMDVVIRRAKSFAISADSGAQ